MSYFCRAVNSRADRSAHLENLSEAGVVERHVTLKLRELAKDVFEAQLDHDAGVHGFFSLQGPHVVRVMLGQAVRTRVGIAL